MLGNIDALADRVAHHAGRITQVENDVLAIGSRDMAMGLSRRMPSLHSDTVIDDEKFDEPVAEAKPATLRNRRESTGTNPPETMKWTYERRRPLRRGETLRQGGSDHFTQPSRVCIG